MTSAPQGDTEPAGFEILAPSAWSVPVVFNSPHSGRTFPEGFVAASQLAEHDLRRTEDSFVDELFISCTNHGVPLLRSTFARAYLDLNREPNEFDQRMFADRLPAHLNNPTARVTSGLGIIPRTIGDGRLIYPGPISLADALSRIEKYYRPYHRILGGLLEEAYKATGLSVLVDCHSMPSSPSIGVPRETPLDDIVIGDRFGASCARHFVEALETAFRDEGFSVRLNKPYAGGFITELHGRPAANRHAVQIEIRRDLYMDEKSLSKNACFVATQNSVARVIKKFVFLVAESLGEQQIRHVAAE